MRNNLFINLAFILFPLTHGLRFPGTNSSSRRILTGDPVHLPEAPAPVPDISSQNPWRMEIEDGSLLIGTPGQRINVRIALSNLEQEERTFSMEVVESAQLPYKFVKSLSQSNLRVPGGEFRVLTLNLQIPEGMSSGRRNIIRVTATHLGSPEIIRISNLRDQRINPNFVRMEFSFLTVYSFSDDIDPRITSSSPPVESQCSNVQDCSNKYWKATYQIKDDESGIRSITTEPFIGAINSGTRRFVHSPYILGDPQWEVRFVLTGSCCETDLRLLVKDGFGNEATQYLIPNGESSTNWGLSGGEIAIIVVSILLVVLFIGVITAIIIIRQRRAESVNEMRRFPTPAERT